MKVGTLDIVPIIDGTAHEPIGNAVTHPDGKIWDCVEHPTDESGRIRLDIGSFLIRIRDRVVLIDAGGGVHSGADTTTGSMLDNLRDAGVDPSDVTDVCFTHMHWDHIGWSTVNGRITFPNATFRLHQDDWTYFMTGATSDHRIRELIAPIEDHVEPFSVEHEILPGLIARPAPGHTPGSTIYIIHDGKERALLLGDTLHTVGELTEPEWIGMWDVDPVAAGIMRNRIADELAATGDPFAPAHFPELAFGRLATLDGLRRFTWVQ
ncbi:MBL fold metallo-hydrolase [Rhodococcus sp. 15-725-2-2b]|jgi:glyoxylase-like metal-dependent hydrolase (beta-lactamase superfamily II)|uniref:MBL fold metallo-hydrolase n=1 Tax=unclassified Rhodococcus (in: high G+C Gram-positive bacteria) TaxID=192944 RepID=UPI000B9B0DE5|nr:MULTISPECIES: MBL fold metallo-hydrolase [unclassified Rhodococcus (in: high G+C Gram-positive bacteria)]OZC61903.1 MBL fold metallo-hydrolase [Rhodococcus sp. 06-470-2]OZC64599.1 MBL fold metallo-hydrolase [Rhodococcus sp. 06-469-3-2]OZD43417.1 MBL fold metallo-hydrolase [Rhodococcus sp. 06-1477-1A]OZE26748.1 MBL fold metallo-hydrolase [Rhodococcus sp. 05-2254-5]OZE52728.1 MBL fold metallo-hydrolase [Rhodococcus sp. 05-2254-1]